MKITDHSDFIAHLSVRIELLTDFDPDGHWATEPLFIAYQRDRYCLSLKQAKQPEQHLENALSQCTQRHTQLDLLGGTSE